MPSPQSLHKRGHKRLRCRPSTDRRLAAAFPELPREYKLSNEYHKQVQEVQLKVPILPLDENKKG
jgi:hypothetical protein